MTKLKLCFIVGITLNFCISATARSKQVLFPKEIQGCWVAASKEFESSEAVDIFPDYYDQGDGRCSLTSIQPHGTEKSIRQWSAFLSCNKGFEGAKSYKQVEHFALQTIDGRQILVRFGHMFDSKQMVLYRRHSPCRLR